MLMTTCQCSESFGREQEVEAMLVLTRRSNERIEIGDNRITVTVLEVHGGRVRLGIEAPASVGIRRQEIVRTLPCAFACGDSGSPDSVVREF